MASDSELDVNLFDVETQQCPYDAYKKLRDDAPVYKQPGTDIYIVTRYEDVRTVLTDPIRFPSAPDPDSKLKMKSANQDRQLKVQQRFQENGWIPEPTLASRDDPNHKQMRAMFNEAFKPSRIKEIDPLRGQGVDVVGGGQLAAVEGPPKR